MKRLVACVLVLLLLPMLGCSASAGVRGEAVRGLEVEGFFEGPNETEFFAAYAISEGGVQTAHLTLATREDAFMQWSQAVADDPGGPQYFLLGEGRELTACAAEYRGKRWMPLRGLSEHCREAGAWEADMQLRLVNLLRGRAAFSDVAAVMTAEAAEIELVRAGTWDGAGLVGECTRIETKAAKALLCYSTDGVLVFGRDHNGVELQLVEFRRVVADWDLEPPFGT